MADGLNTSLLRNSYRPDPNSGQVGSALNFYLAPSQYNASCFGLSAFADFEIPLIDPNLTLGPIIGLGFGNNLNGLNQSVISLGAKATYYADWLIPEMPDQFDVFITSSSGLYLASYSNNTNKIGFDFSTSVGGRYNFSDDLSLYAQTGFGSSFFAVGLSYKL
jgi:hypothetical protein